nr:hypothetical protein [uncultured Dyadobacter sp.]
MKTKYLAALLISVAGTMSLFSACKEKERVYEDSPLITVHSPTRKQIIEDTDSVRIQAVIENKNASLKNVSVWLMDNNKQYIYNQQWPCDCKDEKIVVISTSFLHDIAKTSDLIINIHAEFNNGETVREEAPFRLIDTPK